MVKAWFCYQLTGKDWQPVIFYGDKPNVKDGRLIGCGHILAPTTESVAMKEEDFTLVNGEYEPLSFSVLERLYPRKGK